MNSIIAHSIATNKVAIGCRGDCRLGCSVGLNLTTLWTSVPVSLKRTNSISKQSSQITYNNALCHTVATLLNYTIQYTSIGLETASAAAAYILNSGLLFKTSCDKIVYISILHRFRFYNDWSSLFSSFLTMYSNNDKDKHKTHAWAKRIQRKKVLLKYIHVDN